jgi:hypothetical protein
MLPPEAKVPNPFPPSGAPMTGPSVTNLFFPIPPYSATLHPQHHPTGLFLLQLISGGDRAHIPFRLSKLKEINKDLGSYSRNSDQYIQTFRKVSQNFELSWNNVMILLFQTLTSLEKQQVLDQIVAAAHLSL